MKDGIERGKIGWEGKGQRGNTTVGTIQFVLQRLESKNLGNTLTSHLQDKKDACTDL